MRVIKKPAVRQASFSTVNGMRTGSNVWDYSDMDTIVAILETQRHSSHSTSESDDENEIKCDKLLRCWDNFLHADTTNSVSCKYGDGSSFIRCVKTWWTSPTRYAIGRRWRQSKPACGRFYPVGQLQYRERTYIDWPQRCRCAQIFRMANNNVILWLQRLQRHFTNALH